MHEVHELILEYGVIPCLIAVYALGDICKQCF
jgi:hypothetical protein